MIDTKDKDSSGSARQPGVPILSDGVVRLRAHNTGDLERIVEQCRDPESMRWTTVPRPYTAAHARQFLDIVAAAWHQPGGDRYWAIEEVADDGHRFLGTVDIRSRGGARAEVGYALHPQARGRGVMTRAVRLATRHWFEHGGERMDLLVMVGNFGSLAVAHRLGFQFIETIPGHLTGRVPPMTQEELDARSRTPGGRADAVYDGWFTTLHRDEPMTPRNTWLTQPVLESAPGQANGVRLRPWRDADRDLVEELDDPPHYFPSRAAPTAATWDEWLLLRRLRAARGTSVDWCIADPRTDRSLGEMKIFSRHGAIEDSDTAELGYFLFPSARARGVARRAARLAVDHALRAAADGGLGLRRLVAQTAADNAASNAVLAAVGFTRWGHETAATAPDGSVGPADHWELLR